MGEVEGYESVGGRGVRKKSIPIPEALKERGEPPLSGRRWWWCRRAWRAQTTTTTTTTVVMMRLRGHIYDDYYYYHYSHQWQTGR